MVLRLLLTAALLSSAETVCAQTTLTGAVVEAGTGRPVPFATVEVPARRLGVQATETGKFTLTLPGSLGTHDSLRVASLGFAPRIVAVSKAASCQLELTALAVALPDIVVRPSTMKPIRLGPTEDGDQYGFGSTKLQGEGNTGWQVARKFTSSPAGFIQAVRFYVKPNDFYKQCGKNAVRAPFRVRLYAADGAAGAPGTDLLTTSMLTAATKKGWHEVDLTAFQIRAPAAGFFVAMEWLYTNAAFSCEQAITIRATKEKRINTSYGQILGGYIDDTPQATWNLKTGNSWRQFVITMPKGPVIEGNQNAAIQAILLPD